MKITSLLAEKQTNPDGTKIPTIAFLGDSVTQGCFEIYLDTAGNIQTVFDKSKGYHTRLTEILSVLYPSVPLNIINAGISGDSSSKGVARLERDVISYSPDLTVVSFGLNDSNHGQAGLENYRKNIENIFKRLIESGSEVIFMTANMMNTSISHKIKDPAILRVAEKTMIHQNDGTLDAYFEAGKQAAQKYGVSVCDAYSKWKRLYANGVDITALLSNDINHPIPQMHYLFAVSLLETMME